MVVQNAGRPTLSIPLEMVLGQTIGGFGKWLLRNLRSNTFRSVGNYG
jgi:hypothetical protein